MHSFFKTTLLLTLLALPFGIASAQSLSEINSIGTTDLSVTLRPETPEPHEEISVTVSSLKIDINRAFITWVVNGAVHASGRGLKTTTITAGSAGSSQIIQVFAESTQRGTLETTYRIRPAAVDLIVESNGFAPPLYKGRQLHAFGARARVVAVPQIKTSGRLLRPSELVFDWRLNGGVLQNESGVGRDVLTLDRQTLVGGASDIELMVTARSDASLKANARVEVSSHRPVVLLYLSDPLLGTLYNRALKNTHELTAADITIRALPYMYGNGITTARDLNYHWTMNGSTVSLPEDEHSISLVQEEGSVGTARIDVDVTHPTQALQRGSGSIAVTFSGISQ